MQKLNPPFCALLAEKAESEAAKLGVPMVIALADALGEPVFFSRMPDSLPAAVHLAVTKAYTAAALRMTTAQLGTLAQPGGDLYGIENSMDRKIVLFGGGRPFSIQGKVIGAIGISGGSVAQDICVADAVGVFFDQVAALHDLLAPFAVSGRGWTSTSAGWLKNMLAAQLPQLKEEEIKALTGAVLLKEKRSD
jgi:uncharacterized protein GlcG (DUF336 family)